MAIATMLLLYESSAMTLRMNLATSALATIAVAPGTCHFPSSTLKGRSATVAKYYTLIKYGKLLELSIHKLQVTVSLIKEFLKGLKIISWEQKDHNKYHSRNCMKLFWKKIRSD